MWPLQRKSEHGLGGTSRYGSQLTTMTTSVTASPAGPGATTVTPAQTRGIPRGLLLAAPLFLGIAAAVWATSAWLRTTSDLGSIDQFTVARRSFNVVLTEKGELKAAKETEIVCAVEGRSTIISLIPEGTAVKEGDLLVLRQRWRLPGCAGDNECVGSLIG